MHDLNNELPETLPISLPTDDSGDPYVSQDSTGRHCTPIFVTRPRFLTKSIRQSFKTSIIDFTTMLAITLKIVLTMLIVLLLEFFFSHFTKLSEI